METSEYQKYIYMKTHDGSELIFVRDDLHAQIILELEAELAEARKENERLREQIAMATRRFEDIVGQTNNFDPAHIRAGRMSNFATDALRALSTSAPEEVT